MAKSLNGFPAPPRKLRTISVPNANRRITVADFCAVLFAAFFADYHRWVKAIDEGTWDEGGYNYRPANGSPNDLSNHASGTAVDVNWSKEGAQGSRMGYLFFILNPKNMLAIRRILRIYPVLAWGGDWRARDYMHFELKPGTTETQVRALIAKLGIDSRGVRHNDWKGRPLKSPLDVVA